MHYQLYTHGTVEYYVQHFILESILTRTRAARVGNGFLALIARTVADAATRAAISEVYKIIVKF